MALECLRVLCFGCDCCFLLRAAKVVTSCDFFLYPPYIYYQRVLKHACWGVMRSCRAAVGVGNVCVERRRFCAQLQAGSVQNREQQQ